jgi:uncharacterized membrane protein YfcA
MDSLLSLPASLQLSYTEWGLAIIAILILGFSKSGIKGVAIICVTLLALVFGSKSSTGIIIPMLIVGDIFAVIYYNKHCKWKYLFQFLPWMIAGVLLGVFLGKDMPEDVFKKIMSIVIFLSVGMMYWWDQQSEVKIPESKWLARSMGLAAGFTTMIGNLAGAFSNIFFLAVRLPKNEFIGTAAWLFFIINLFKLPFHIWVWETVSLETLAINLRLLPILAIGLLVGLQIVKKIKDKIFRKLILILTALGALLILIR